MFTKLSRRLAVGGLAVLGIAIPLDACDDDGCAAVCITDPGQQAAPAPDAPIDLGL